MRLRWLSAWLGGERRGLGGAGRNRTLGVEALQEILVPIPPVAEQLRLDALFQEVVELQRSQQAVDAALDALLPAVLDRAFRGEL